MVEPAPAMPDQARKLPGVSVFFPAYNDSGTIASMVIRAVKAASDLTPDYEVIVVDDGSTDATAEIADELARSDPLHRIVIGRLYHHIVSALFGLTVRDVDCDFRLLRRSIFDRIQLQKTSGVICLEMMKKITDAQFRIVEVPVHHYHRAYGKS